MDIFLISAEKHMFEVLDGALLRSTHNIRFHAKKKMKNKMPDIPNMWSKCMSAGVEVSFTHLCRIDSSTSSLWTGPFQLEGMSSKFLYGHVL